MKIVRDINIIVGVIVATLFVARVSLAEPAFGKIDVSDIGIFTELDFGMESVVSSEALSFMALSLGMPYKSAMELASASGMQDSNKIIVDKKFTKKPKETKEKIKEPVYEAVTMEPEIKEAVEKAEEKPKIGISVSPFLSYSRIDATDVSNGAKGGVLSDPGFGTEFKFMQIWSDYFTGEMIARIENVSYKTNSGRTFDRHGGRMLNFGAGAGFRPFKKLKRLELKGRAFYGDEFYFRAPSTTSLAIDNTKALKGDVALNFDIVTSKYASAGIGAGGRVIFPSYVDVSGVAGYNTKTGYGYFGSFYMKHNFKHVVIEESFTYENLYKDTDLFNQTQMAVYLNVGATLLFGTTK